VSLIHSQSVTSNDDFEKGLRLYEAAKYYEAAQAFKRVTERDPKNAEAFYQLANSYFRMLRYKEAVKAYQRVIQLKPDHYLAYNNLGTTYHALGQFRDAVKAYEEAIRLKADYQEAIFGLGVAYLELKDKDAALEQHKRLTALDIERADKLYAYITDKKIPLTILNGKALSLTKPIYPPQARQAHVSGTVLVWVSIDETGKVVSASAVTGQPILRRPAVEAAKLARFSPTMLDGRPVKVTGIIAYNFVAP
jgi:TonB family protein